MTLSDTIPTLSSGLLPDCASCLSRLQELTAALALMHTSEDVADAILLYASPEMGTANGHLVLLNEDGQSLRLVRSVGFEGEDIASWTPFRVSAPLPMAEAVRTKSPIFVGSLAEIRQRFPLLTGTIFAREYHTLIALPLLFGARPLGAVVLAFSAPRTCTPEEMTYLQIVVQQCAVTLERVRIFERERDARQQLEKQREELETTVWRLAETTSRFEQLMEMSPDAIMIHQDGRIVYANKSFVRQIGAIRAEDLIGLPLLAMVKPESHAYVEAKIREVWESRKSVETNGIQAVTLKGISRLIDSTAAACEWECRPAIQVICRDVSDRCEAERKLKESEEQFRFLAEAIPHFVWSAEADGKIDYGNPRLLEYLGLSLERMPAWSWAEAVHPDDQGRAVAAWTDAIQAGGEFRIEYRIRGAASGEYRWLQGLALPLRDEQGNVVRWYGTCTDIHERKTAEEQLSRLQNLLQSILTHAPAAIWVKDLDLRYVLANPGALAEMGRSEEEILGRSNEELFAPDDNARAAREQDMLVLESRQPYFFESNVTFDSTPRTRFASKFPLFAPDGSLYGLGAVALDITEHKKLEQQYLQAQKMEGIGRLAGGIAHDFNNLLAVILGYAEMVEMEMAEDSPMLANVHKIETAATRAATLTKQLLAFARRQATVMKVFCPNDLFATVSQMLKPLIGERIELKMKLQPDLGNVKADANQMEQVIVNLVVNARDAMSDGGVLLLETYDLTLTAPVWNGIHVATGEYVALSVTDNGEGMTAEVKARLFEPFFSTKGVGVGTGLGLATCYGIVKQHKGYISIDSEVGAGTTVQVCLPRAVGESVRIGAVGGTARAPKGAETILVVEDEQMLRDLTVSTLRANGYTVLEAEDGVEALRIAAAHTGTLHLLLSDMVMPHIGGQELAARLRELHPEARVLFVSGYSADVFDARHTLNPDVPLLQKPFTSPALLTRIREILAG